MEKRRMHIEKKDIESNLNFEINKKKIDFAKRVLGEMYEKNDFWCMTHKEWSISPIEIKEMAWLGKRMKRVCNKNGLIFVAKNLSN